MATIKREGGSNLFIVAVDESHGDSHDAFLAARSFAAPEDKISLFSVVPKTEVSDEKKAELIKSFVDYATKDDRVFTSIAAKSDTDSIAKVFIKEAKTEDATCLFLGCGSKLSRGALGSVVEEILRISLRSVCVVKPGSRLKPTKPKEVIMSFHGTDHCKAGLVELLQMLNPAIDSLKIVTVSHFNGEKDKAVLEQARECCAGSAMKIEFEFVERTRGNSVGFELITFADKQQAELLVTAQVRSKEPRLGSTSTYVCTHGTTSVLVVKPAMAQAKNE